MKKASCRTVLMVGFPFFKCVFVHTCERTLTLRVVKWALTDVAQLVGCHPVKWKVTGLIPGQGTCLGCRFGPPSGRVQEATNQSTFLSLSFSLPSPRSKNK